MSALTCTTCNRPSDNGYVNEAAGERCVDPCHSPRSGMHVHIPCRASKWGSVQMATRQVERGGCYKWLVTWCDQWELVDELAMSGVLERENYGAATFGHCDYYYR